MSRPAAPGAPVILCSRCKGIVGHVSGSTFQIRDRGRWITWVAASQPEGEIQVWCQGCKQFGALDVQTVIRRARTESKIRARLRWIYVGDGT